MGGMSGGGGGGGGGGNLASSIVSSVANIAAGHYANRKLKKGTREAIAQQERANALYQQNYEQTQGEYKPYQEAGTSALGALMRTYGLAEGQNGKADFSGFENSPDYLWAQQQGIKAHDTSAASTGRLYSGGYAKALGEYNQGLATQHLGNYRNGLGNISTQGLNATNAMAHNRNVYGNQLGGGYENIGNLLYARRLGQANINYKNVAAQDSIWGGQQGQQQGGQQQQGSGMNFLSPQQGSNVNSSGYSVGNNWNMNWGGG